jgi:hypothetical protein
LRADSAVRNSRAVGSLPSGVRIFDQLGSIRPANATLFIRTPFFIGLLFFTGLYATLPIN